MQKIAFFNQKGGVGKTSSTFHLAATLGTMGRRVLAIDNDPQGSLTQGIIGPAAFSALEPRETLLSCYAGNRPFPEDVIRTTSQGFDLVAGSKGVDLYNRPAPELGPDDEQRCLRVFLDQVEPDYDLVLIDCPPNRYGASWSACVAADWIVIPLQPEDYGSQGISPVHETIEDVRQSQNPELRILGYLPTMVDRRLGLHGDYLSMLRKLYGPAVFESVFPRAKDFMESVAQRKAISAYKPRSAAAKAVRAIAAELDARAQGHFTPTVSEVV